MTRGASTRRLGRLRPLFLVVGVLWLALVTGAAGAVQYADASAKRHLETEFAQRATEGARFAQFYVDQTFRRQHAEAAELLSDAVPSQERFEVVALSLGYPAAVLLDERGRVLNVAPANPAMVGRDLTSGYEHLRQAVAGSNAVSAVVPSAVTGLPIIAFAVPFDTPSGRRVLSGGREPSDTSLAAFLRDGIGIDPVEAYLIGADSQVMATSAASVTPGQTLGSQNPVLAEAVGARPAGLVRLGAESTYFTSAAVGGTSWRIVVTIPTVKLYEPVGGGPTATARALVAAVALGGLALAAFVVRLADAARDRRTTVASLEANARQLAAARDEAVDAAMRLEEAQRLAHLGSWEWDVSTGRVAGSDELYRIFGLEPEHAVASFDDLFGRLHPDDRQMVQGAVTWSIETHEPLDYQVRLHTDEGEVRWIDVQAEVKATVDGGGLRMTGTLLDITDRVRAREELEASDDAVIRDREFLAAVLHNLSDGVIACNADGVLTLFNRATQEFHGLPVSASAEVGDWACRSGLYRADGVTPMEPAEIPLARALRGDNVHDMEMVIVPDEGSRRVVRVSAQAIYDFGGKVLGAVAAMHDITEHRQAEVDLAALNADLERRVLERTAEADRANQAKSEFVSRMSHELRTPLNAMLGFAQLLGMDELAPDQAESVEHIMSGGRHLLALINDVLDLALIESGSLAVLIEPTVLGTVVDEALDLVRRQADWAAVSLPAHAPAGADVPVLADRQRLCQVVVNLLSNAVKYNSEAGAVSLACERRGSRLRLLVTDSGPGISAEDADRIFVPFERLAAGGTPTEGTGLGLAISKQLAAAMGADIGLTSMAGRGSTFWIDLPVAHLEAAPPEAPTRVAWKPGSGAGRATVLYIEDNPSNLQLVRALLNRLPHIRLLTATSGHLGLDLAHREVPDLVLLDLGLPDFTGAEVLTRLQAHPATANIPVVVVSADATRSQVQRLLAAGADAYLTKPLDVGLFMATVEEALQRPQAVSSGGASSPPR